LQAAVMNDEFDIVELLLDKGADVNAQGGLYGNALQAAAMDGNFEIVILLLDKGAEVNAQGGLYGNALQAAAGRGHTATEKLLLDHGAVRPSSSNLRLMYEKLGANITGEFYSQREAAYLCSRKGLYKEAIIKLQKALELAKTERFDPNTTSYLHCLETAQVLNSLASLHQVLGLFEEASSYYKTACKINPDDHNLSLLSSFVTNDVQLPELLEALAGSIPLLFYGIVSTNSSSSSHTPNFIQFPWSLPSLFVDCEAEVASISNLIALTELVLPNGEGPQIRADTIREFLAEIWPITGPVLVDSLKSIIRDLRGGSRISSQYVYWKAQTGELDREELSVRSDPTVPIILIATYERLIVMDRSDRPFWTEICACISWIISVTLPPPRQGYQKVSFEIDHSEYGLVWDVAAPCSHVHKRAPTTTVPSNTVEDRRHLLFCSSISSIRTDFSELVGIGCVSIPSVITRSKYISPEPEMIRDDSLYSGCWMQLFRRATVAVLRNPLPEHGGKGLRLSFETMAALAGTREIVSRNGGIVLTGFATVLIPKHFVDKNARSVQWHLEVNNDNRQFFQPMQYHEDFETLIAGDRLLTESPDELAGTAYLGWADAIEMILGTGKNMVEPKVSGLLEAGVKYLRGNQAISFNAQIAPPPFVIGATCVQTFDRIGPEVPYTQSADSNLSQNWLFKCSVIIYDQQSKRAWMSPMVNVIACMVRLYLSTNGYVGAQFSIPEYSATASDRRKALPYLTRTWEDKIQQSRPLTYGQLITHLCTRYHEAYNKLDDRLNSLSNELVGFELRDFVSPSSIVPKKLQVNSAIKKWRRLVDRTTRIMFCTNLGAVAEQMSDTPNRCPSFGPPLGLDVLVCPGYLLKEKFETVGCTCSRDPVQHRTSELAAYEWRFRGAPFQCGHGQPCDGLSCWTERLQTVEDISRISIKEDAPRHMVDKIALDFFRFVVGTNREYNSHPWNFEGGICFGIFESKDRRRNGGIRQKIYDSNKQWLL